MNSTTTSALVIVFVIWICAGIIMLPSIHSSINQKPQTSLCKDKQNQNLIDECYLGIAKQNPDLNSFLTNNKDSVIESSLVSFEESTVAGQPSNCVIINQIPNIGSRNEMVKVVAYYTQEGNLTNSISLWIDTQTDLVYCSRATLDSNITN